MMHLKKLISLAVLSSVLVASENTSLLSELKQQKLDIDKQKIELESTNLKYNWLSQVKGSYSKTMIEGKKSGADEIDSLAITLDQPIFKSGGIFYAIKYAGANKEFLKLSTTLNEQNLIKSVIASWLNLKKLDLQIDRQKYLIENAKIDIIRKKEQYESGFLDSSFLDTAILSKGSMAKNLIDMESGRYSELMRFKSLSDADYNAITPPTFSMIDKKSYINKSLILKQQIAQANRADYIKKMVITNYLPTISFTAGYFDTEDNLNQGDSYHNLGLKVSMPLLDFNIARNIEIKQLDHLKSKVETQDTKILESNLYDDSVKKIGFLKKKIQIVENDVKLYDSLLLSTKESYKAGEKTIFDVDTLSNSQQSILIEKEIYKIDKQKVLLDLYAKMQNKI